MSAPNITIRRESRPARCEVCHQVDQFDPKTLRCLRCDSLSAQSAIATPKGRIQKNSIEYSNAGAAPDNLTILAMFFGFIAIVPGIFLGPPAIILSLIAVILGKVEQRKIKSRRGALTDEALVKIAIFCGYGGILIVLLLGLVYGFHVVE